MRDLSFKIVLLFSLCGLIWWWTGFSNNQITVYSANCTSLKPIVLPTHALDKNRDANNFDRYKRAHTQCGLSALGATTYTINSARAEVYYDSLGIPERLVNCAILDAKNWRCAYQDGSGHVTVLDGLEALKRGHESFRFSIYRYQWWYVRLHWFFLGKPPVGFWLIPEQTLVD